MGMNVFLGNSPWNKPGFYGVRAGSRWPHFEPLVTHYMPFPFQLAYAAALLEQHKFNVLLVDGIAERITEEAFIVKILSFQPDLIVLEVSTPSFDHDLKFVKRLRKRVGSKPKIAFCGPHAPMFKKRFLQTCPDIEIVFVGEYDRTVYLTTLELSKQGDLKHVPGLIFRDPAGCVVDTGPPKIFNDIDELPWPARHFLPMHSYFDLPGNIPTPSLQMWSSRGCPYSCTFCVWPQLMNGDRYRVRDSHKILDEIESTCAAYQFRSFYFDDDTFNVGKRKVLEFCNAKVKRGIDLPWAIMARADLMDREMLEALVASNLKAVKYGIESADPKLLDHVHKRMDLEKAIRGVRLTQQMGIKVHLTFMFGIPGETHDSIQKTIKLAKKLDPESAQFSVLTPFPGTQIFDELKANGHLIEAGWNKYNGYYNAVIRTEALDAVQLEQALKKAWRIWIRHKAVSNFKWANIVSYFQRVLTRIKRQRIVFNQK